VAPDYARAFAANFGVKFLPFRAPAISREYFIYQRKRQALSPAGVAFVQMLRRYAGSAKRRGKAASDAM
jgi:DNA-binding transcriptional LysR family regulator